MSRQQAFALIDELILDHYIVPEMIKFGLKFSSEVVCVLEITAQPVRKQLKSTHHALCKPGF
jgi:hypothetical protein